MAWSLGQDMPSPLWGHCSVIFGGNIVVIGGWDRAGANDGNTFSDSNWDSNRSMRSVRFLHRGRWKSHSNLRHGRSTHGCTVTNYKVKSAGYIS